MKKTLKWQLTVKLTGLLAAGTLSAQDPATAPDDSWISVSGTVTEVSPNTFNLDYGDGILVVEMDDWDSDADAYKVAQGDKVTAYGRVDDDLFEMRTLEAASVYVEDLNTYFYASAADEEDSFVTVVTPIVVGDIIVEGTVTEVTESDEFVLQSGLRTITVETEEMPYNPLDDEGFQKIEEGDRVSVEGEIDDDFLEGRELVAESIITLSREDEES